MDPKACLEMARAHVDAMDRPGGERLARTQLALYRRWRYAHGFEPTMDDGMKGDQLARELCNHMGYACLDHIIDTAD